MPHPSAPHPITPLTAEQIKRLTSGSGAEPSENPLSPYYSEFAVQSRVLLTGHSHQAWPDCAKEGVLAAFADAARHVDDKWGLAEEQAQRVRAGFAKRLDDPDGQYVLGQNVHELGLRWLSALPAYRDAAGLGQKLPLLTTDQEFHSLRRQLDRLAEYGLGIHKEPMGLDIAARLAEKVRAKRYGGVIVSAVSFKQGLRLSGFGELAAACSERDTPLLIDAYHAVNVVPLSVAEEGLGSAFITGGGYKYCQLGEGNCFLRLPAGHSGRPALTGWFADVPTLNTAQAAVGVAYPPGLGSYAGSTYDPTSHYRGARVFQFFDELGLTVRLLRQISQRQIARLRQGIEELGLPADQLAVARPYPNTTDQLRAGFLALQIPRAGEWVAALRRHDVWCDARETTLRLGPAPYVSDQQLDAAVAAIAAVAQELG